MPQEDRAGKCRAETGRVSPLSRPMVGNIDADRYLNTERQVD